MQTPIHVTYKSTSNAYTANQYLAEIQQHPLFAADFEIAIRYSPEELTAYKEELLSEPPKRRQIELQGILNATALDHPYHCTLTHLSIAISDHEAYVFILDNPKITRRVLQFLVTTTQKQVWHNATFDFKYVYYHTGKFPINYEDTQIFAKTLLNNTDNSKSLTGLKHLAGHVYGDWGISSDNFTTTSYYDEKMLRYAATDACATYWLYYSIFRHVESQNEDTMQS